MKTPMLTFALFVAILPCQAQEFIRPLPDIRISGELTQDKFKNSDAVIILKEQSLSLHASEVMYRGVEFSGTAMTTNTILLAKVFNDAGVKRFGSFEFEYVERFGDEIRAGFGARARVLKPTGDVVTMPESAVQIEVSRKNSSNDPLARKALFKVPDLAPGDIVQVEYTLTEPFARTLSGIFYYNERVPVLFSNLAITLLASDDVRVFSFPADQVGEPKTSMISKSIGAGPTYFWSVRNPNPIPREPYANTLEDLSLLTAFIADRRSGNGFRSITDWASIAKDYHHDYVDKGGVKDKRIVELGLSPDEKSVTPGLIDSLYTALRRSVRLAEKNSLYPLVDDIDDIFTRKTGDASDMAYIFYQILRQWKVDVKPVWIRDRRDGMYEASVPTTHWFDRMGVLVQTGGGEKCYDFDRAIPSRYETPWFLKGISVPVVEEKGCAHKALALPGTGQAYIHERHDIDLSTTAAPHDRMVYAFRGAPAEKFRDRVYDLHGSDLNARLRTLVLDRCLESSDTLLHTQILDQPEIEVTSEGPSKAAVATVDSFVTIKLVNQALQGLRDEIFTPVRFNDVVWDDMFSISVDWRVHPPAGYAPHAIPRDTSLFAGPGFGGVVKFQRNGEMLDIQLRLNVSEPGVPSQRFPNIVRTLDGLLAGAGQAITFKKIVEPPAPKSAVQQKTRVTKK